MVLFLQEAIKCFLQEVNKNCFCKKLINIVFARSNKTTVCVLAYISSTNSIDRGGSIATSKNKCNCFEPRQ